MISFIKSAINFFYPVYCQGCGERLEGGRRFICEKCFEALPKYQGMEPYYGAMERLSGLVPYTEYQSDLIFRNPGLVRTLIHKIKYDGFPTLGTELSRYFASKHLALGHFLDVTMIVPVPLIMSRYHTRGYNQSTYIAQGIAEVYHLPIAENVLCRRGARGTQTRKGKEERWQHTQGAFYVPTGIQVTGKRILVVDDVLTSGATLIQCGRALLDAGAESVSFYTLSLDVHI